MTESIISADRLTAEPDELLDVSEPSSIPKSQLVWRPGYGWVSRPVEVELVVVEAEVVVLEPEVELPESAA